jgi:dGTPase
MNELKHDLMQKFKPSDRFEPSIEKQLPIKQLSIEDDILLTLDRNAFARDGDRILFSRAFRRLQHKAQVFSNESGDHFRTRLTHTLEVSQISRSLARYLQADEYLTEAIAIGHDIGHTPFGHQGERVLDDVMMGEDDLGLIKCHFDFGGFKHNYNSLRVLDIVQSKFEKHDGLNLSWQVLEGILKHTKVKRHSSRNNKAKSWNIDLFISNPSLKDRLYLIYGHSVTLEGQIVTIADEIAQRQHDIDDGLRYTKLRMEVDTVYRDIIKICQEIIKDETLATKEQYIKAIELLNELKKKLTANCESKNSLFKNDSLVRDIIEYFILDVFNYSREVIQNGVQLINDGDRRILDKKIIDFSPIGKMFNDKLEALVKNRILNSYEVNKFDGKSRFIVRQLFKAYYTNPLQMPSYALYRLEGNLNRKADTCKIKLLLEDGTKTEMKKIDFKTMDRAIVKPLISSLKLEKINVNVEVPDDSKDLFEELADEKEISKQFYCKLKELNDGKDDNSNQSVFLKCLLGNHYMYLATICDYISGMSDNYAKKEYKELYLVD